MASFITRTGHQAAHTLAAILLMPGPGLDERAACAALKRNLASQLTLSPEVPHLLGLLFAGRS